jgi:hypothetical protein
VWDRDLGEKGQDSLRGENVKRDRVPLPTFTPSSLCHANHEREVLMDLVRSVLHVPHLEGESFLATRELVKDLKNIFRFFLGIVPHILFHVLVKTL